MSITPIKSGTGNLANVIYQQIKDDIFSFKLKPGQRFTETDLSEKYEVSRTPTRQALYRLEQEGYVNVHFRSGWEIKPLDFTFYQELFDLRMILEKEAVKRLCVMDHEQSEELQNLKRLWLVDEQDYNQNTQALVLQSEDFHCALVRAAGNRQIAKIHHEISEKIRIVLSLGAMREFDIQHAYQDHAAILRCILARDADGAIHLAEHHVLHSIEDVKKITLKIFSTV
ncbi:GntR family transcriptional regulator [Acinetobacter sp. Ver3]|uniref:GntR family transcriptional regulator n=1 Tax=Acinetobacter sp. Ver3 TaxID=466088 RepID=UPI00044D4241|nr:GntR family transcriptional regulator [Acinetobacter sp. Ver3]EZQ04770.1 GntR family transcriptional regulator [Acinetobacter sp. Ver3]